MATINGLGDLTVGEVEAEIALGARFVVYEWCISILIITFWRETPVHYLRPYDRGIRQGMPWSALTFLLGWWGIPWEIIRTPIAIIRNLAGGRDVTMAIMDQISQTSAVDSVADSDRV